MSREPPRLGQRWQPGEHEAVSCRAKQKYATAGDAGRAKQAIVRRLSRPGPDSLNVYRCCYCHGWHLGRPQKQKKLKTRRRGQGQSLDDS